MAIDGKSGLLNYLNKENVYCYSCYKENKLTPLDFNINILSYNICIKHKGRNFKTLRWCKKSNHWHCFYGISKESKCQSCILSERNKTQKMIEVSKQNGYLYGSQNMIRNHQKFDFEITCNQCNDNECKSRQKFIEKGLGDNKLHKFLNNSCIDKMLTDEIRSKNTSKNNIKNWQNPEYAKHIAQNLGSYLGNPDWAREIGIKGRETLQKIFQEDSNFGKKIINKALQYLDSHPEIRKECGKKNIVKAKEFKINAIKEQLSNINVLINNKIIKYDDIRNLYENDICGVYLIRGKYKKDNEIYNLLVCKSINVYNEIYWILRVLSQSEKQDKYNNSWTTAKWWYIANLYYDFEFTLLTDEKGVSENEALLAEAIYGIENNMICDKEQIIKDGYSKNHSYWSL